MRQAELCDLNGHGLTYQYIYQQRRLGDRLAAAITLSDRAGSRQLGYPGLPTTLTPWISAASGAVDVMPADCRMP